MSRDVGDDVRGLYTLLLVPDLTTLIAVGRLAPFTSSTEPHPWICIEAAEEALSFLQTVLAEDDLGAVLPHPELAVEGVPHELRQR